MRRLFTTIIVLVLTVLPLSSNPSQTARGLVQLDNTLAIMGNRTPAEGWRLHEDAAYGFSIVIPADAIVEPANGQPGSCTRVIIQDPDKATSKISIAIGVFIVDKPPQVEISEWVQPSPSLASDLATSQPITNAGPFGYAQSYSGKPEGELNGKC